MNQTLTDTQLLSTEGKLSKKEETEGYNLEVGESWIYPTNFPVREYQFNIIHQAIYKNTMVCLPTGLGKTFIAAVIMYNFFRWYPQGKIIFLAPTRPLVKQQIDACYDIMAIPRDVTAELTGTNIQASRANIWNEKRVFFVTPQVLQNDIDKVPDLSKNIKCLVFDEAHKARGNHAYCEVIKKICLESKYFRVLALSATPGNSISDVVKVCQSLLIAHLEIRTEECPDVKPYVFKRTMETIIVPFGEKLTQIRADYINVLDKYVRTLIKYRVLQGNCATLTKGRMFMVMKEFQEKNKHNKGGSYNEIVKTLNICIILYHGFEVLERHGMRGFLKFSEDNREKPLLKNNDGLQNIMDEVRDYLGPTPNVQMLPDGSIDDIPENTKFGHPKYYKLSEILLKHFSSTEESTRVIVFCEFKESVMEAYAILLKYKSILKPRVFMGQGAISQKQQIAIIKAFKTGECNTLISTCIGEEGLDVGEVDLIVCFDISNKSPIRMIQRIGRTGRRREGKVVMLVTEGKEYQLLQECLQYKNSLSNNILKSRELLKELYKNNPKMIPDHINLSCLKMHITVTKPVESGKNNNIKSMFNTISKNNATEEDILDFVDKIPLTTTYFDKIEPFSIKHDSSRIDFSSKLQKQKKLHSTDGDIGSSVKTNLLVSLLEFADCKRYNIPMVQTKIFPKSGKQTTKNDGFKQSDIRSMFQKQNTQQSQKAFISQVPVNIDHEDNSKNDLYLNELNAEISNYLSFNRIDASTCKICDKLFICDYYEMQNNEFIASSWVQPDISILNTLNVNSLHAFLDSGNKTTIIANDNDMFDQFDDLDDIMANIDIPNKIDEKKVNIDNKNVQLTGLHDMDSKPNENVIRNTPSSDTNKCSNQFNLDDEFDNTVLDIEEEMEVNTTLGQHNLSNDTSDVKVNTSLPRDDKYKHVIDNVKFSVKDMYCTFELPTSAKKILPMQNDENAEKGKSNQKPFNSIERVHETFKHCLDFFNVNSFNEIFESVNGEVNNPHDLDATIVLSQSILHDYTKQIEGSPKECETSKLTLDTKTPSPKRLSSSLSPIILEVNTSIVSGTANATSPKSQSLYESPINHQIVDVQSPIRNGSYSSRLLDQNNTTPKRFSVSKNHQELSEMIDYPILSCRSKFNLSPILGSCKKTKTKKSSNRTIEQSYKMSPINLDTPIKNSKLNIASPRIRSPQTRDVKNKSENVDLPIGNTYETDVADGSPILCSYRKKQLKNRTSKRLFDESDGSINETLQLSFNNDDLNESLEKIVVKKHITPKPNLSTLIKRRDGFYLQSTSKKLTSATSLFPPKKIFSENKDNFTPIKKLNESSDLFDSTLSSPISQCNKGLNMEDFCDESFLNMFATTKTNNPINAKSKPPKNNTNIKNMNVSIDDIFADYSFDISPKKSKEPATNIKLVTEDFFDENCFGILTKKSDYVSKSDTVFKSKDNDDFETSKRNKVKNDDLFILSPNTSTNFKQTRFDTEDFFDENCFGISQKKTKNRVDVPNLSTHELPRTKNKILNLGTSTNSKQTMVDTEDFFDENCFGITQKKTENRVDVPNLSTHELPRTKNKMLNLGTSTNSKQTLVDTEDFFDENCFGITQNKTKNRVDVPNLSTHELPRTKNKILNLGTSTNSKQTMFDTEDFFDENCFGITQKKTKNAVDVPKLSKHDLPRTINKTDNLEANDFCDMDMFGLLQKKNEIEIKEKPKKLTINDICDMSIFDMFTNPTPKTKINNNLDNTELTVSQILKLNDLNHTHIKTNHVLQRDEEKKITDKPEKQIDTQSSQKNASQKTVSVKNKYKSLNIYKSQETKADCSKICKKNVPSHLQTKMPNMSEYLKVFKKSTPKTITQSYVVSDDDFELSPIREKMININNDDNSPVIRRNKPTLKINDTATTSFSKEKFINKNNSSSDTIDLEADEFEDVRYNNKKSLTPKHSKKHKKSSQFAFIHLEADESLDASTDSEYIGGSSQDKFEESFVHDETEDFQDTTDMHAIYLQSVKSPLKGRGAFKLPMLPTKIRADIFSQAVTCNDSYVNDSFCVNTEDITLTQRDLSELEIAENLLKEKRKRKKKLKDKKTMKRRRIVLLNDDSD